MKKYKYADELEEGDVISQMDAGELDWYMVHQPRSHQGRAVAILVPLNPGISAIRMDKGVTSWVEVATLQEHPEVLMRLAALINQEQAEGGREPQVVDDDDPDADELPWSPFNPDAVTNEEVAAAPVGTKFISPRESHHILEITEVGRAAWRGPGWPERGSSEDFSISKFWKAHFPMKLVRP